MLIDNRAIAALAGLVTVSTLWSFGNATAVGAPAPASSTMRHATFGRLRGAVRRRTTTTSCDENQGTPNEYFVGVTASGNVAGGLDSGVLAGDGDEACDDDSAVAAGEQNVIANSDSAVDSFVGGGVDGSITAADAFIGSGSANAVMGSQSFIGAGNSNQIAASVSDAFVGGGIGNVLDGEEGVIGGGGQNGVGASATFGAILGGFKNSATAEFASVVGGDDNVASGEFATAIGGAGNSASGSYAIVAGGNANVAAGTLSYVAGYHAEAGHNGSFVWSDYRSGSATVGDTAADQFVARASGGYFLYSNEAATSGVELTPGSGTWASLSDRNAKTNVVPLDGEAMLAKLDTLPIDAWQYRSERGVRHAGPMAQDFYAAFGLGTDDRHIASIDEDGVALAAIQALHVQLTRTQASDRAKAGETERLHREMRDLAREMHRLEARIR